MHSLEEDTLGSGRSEDTLDMVWAAGLPVWDPEKLLFELLEAVGVLGMARKDIEGAMETVAAGELQASHHA